MARAVTRDSRRLARQTSEIARRVSPPFTIMTNLELLTNADAMHDDDNHIVMQLHTLIRSLSSSVLVGRPLSMQLQASLTPGRRQKLLDKVFVACHAYLVIIFGL